MREKDDGRHLSPDRLRFKIIPNKNKVTSIQSKYLAKETHTLMPELIVMTCLFPFAVVGLQVVMPQEVRVVIIFLIPISNNAVRVRRLRVQLIVREVHHVHGQNKISAIGK